MNEDAKNNLQKCSSKGGKKKTNKEAEDEDRQRNTGTLLAASPFVSPVRRCSMQVIGTDE